MNKKIIGTVVALLLCVGVGVGSVKWYEHTQIEALEVEEKALCDWAPEAIDHIIFEKDSAQTFVKEDGAWQNTAHPTVAYNQGLISNVAYQIAHLQSYKIVRNVKDATAYGINEHSNKVTVQNNSGETATYFLGNKVPEENATFIWYEQKDLLALVKDINLASIMVPTSEMIEPFIHLPQLQDVNKVEIKQNGESFVTLVKDEEWMMMAPFNQAHKVDGEKVETYFSLLERIKKEKVVENTGNHLSEYGLEVPVVQVLLNDEITLSFGSKSGNGVYFKLNEESEVYEIQGNITGLLTNIEPFEWIDKTLYIPERKTLSFVEVHYLEDVYRLDLKDAEVVPALNGASISGEVKENLLQALTTILLDKHIHDAKLEETNPRAAEVVIRYGSLENEEVVFEFVPYDPSFYLVRYEGSIEFATAKKPLIELINVFKEAVVQEEQ